MLLSTATAAADAAANAFSVAIRLQIMLISCISSAVMEPADASITAAATSLSIFSRSAPNTSQKVPSPESATISFFRRAVFMVSIIVDEVALDVLVVVGATTVAVVTEMDVAWIVVVTVVDVVVEEVAVESIAVVLDCVVAIVLVAIAVAAVDVVQAASVTKCFHNIFGFATTPTDTFSRSTEFPRRQTFFMLRCENDTQPGVLRQASAHVPEDLISSSCWIKIGAFNRRPSNCRNW